MKEIGGYFEFEKLIDKEYYKNLKSVNTSRNALLYIIYAKKIKKVYIPFYLCDSINNVLEKNKIDFEYYNVDKEFRPIFDSKLKKDEYLYFVNIFGIFNNNELKKINKKYKNIIIDNTHAFFQKPIKNIATIYSCRKFFGVPDGAYFTCNKSYNRKLETDKSKDRFKHLLGRYEETASEYYKYFSDLNKKFANEEIKEMSKVTHNLMGAIDYKNVKKRRIENYNVLKKELTKYNKLSLKIGSVPFCYPLYIGEKGEQLRKELINKNIYVPVLWPNVCKCGQDIEEEYSKNILPIPCDQRYNKEDMKKIIDLINVFMSTN